MCFCRGGGGNDQHGEGRGGGARVQTSVSRLDTTGALWDSMATCLLIVVVLLQGLRQAWARGRGVSRCTLTDEQCQCQAALGQPTCTCYSDVGVYDQAAP
jgi:hypothetical protein